MSEPKSLPDGSFPLESRGSGGGGCGGYWSQVPVVLHHGLEPALPVIFQQGLGT